MRLSIPNIRWRRDTRATYSTQLDTSHYQAGHLGVRHRCRGRMLRGRWLATRQSTEDRVGYAVRSPGSSRLASAPMHASNARTEPSLAAGCLMCQPRTERTMLSSSSTAPLERACRTSRVVESYLATHALSQRRRPWRSTIGISGLDQGGVAASPQIGAHQTMRRWADADRCL